MNPFLAFFVRVLIVVPAAVMAWLVSFFAFDQTFLLSAAYSFATGAIAFWSSSAVMTYRFLKKHRLSRKEYQYIKKNLEEAKRKLSRLHKALFSIRHFPSLKQRIELTRVTRKIYSLTKKEPKRFYQAERFYFSHLDSAVELAEKYVFLSAQPKKNQELELSLIETRRTLEELTHTVEEDLYHVISNDIEQLNFEIDVARHSINTDESRRLK